MTKIEFKNVESLLYLTDALNNLKKDFTMRVPKKVKVNSIEVTQVDDEDFKSYVYITIDYTVNKTTTEVWTSNAIGTRKPPKYFKEEFIERLQDFEKYIEYKLDFEKLIINRPVKTSVPIKIKQK